MIKNCAVNERALAVLDPIRDQLGCSYSDAILELSQQNPKSDIDRINIAFGSFHDTILGVIEGEEADKLFLELVRIILIHRLTGNYTAAELQNINKTLETLFDRTRNEVK